MHNDGSDTPDHWCESKDNGQCGVSPIAQESINKSGVQAYDPKRCKNVVGKSVNNKGKLFETNVSQKSDSIHTMPVFDISW